MDQFTPCSPVANCGLRTSDFGTSFVGERPPTLNTPTGLLPPEAFFPRETIGPSVDIWMLGCILYDILGGWPLF